VIEHNLDLVRAADWIIDLGPEAGPGGGRIVAAGRPREVAEVAASHTGTWLKPVLEGGTTGKARVRSEAGEGAG
jgi:excinuclease ABC subunit A